MHGRGVAQVMQQIVFLNVLLPEPNQTLAVWQRLVCLQILHCHSHVISKMVTLFWELNQGHAHLLLSLFDYLYGNILDTLGHPQMLECNHNLRVSGKLSG